MVVMAAMAGSGVDEIKLSGRSTIDEEKEEMQEKEVVEAVEGELDIAVFLRMFS